ncbi:MAG: copper amine oxidase N-terminal domain-containing protein, partial [Moorellaceae bacterium]
EGRKLVKTRKRWLSVLVALTMLVGLMVPFAAPAPAEAATSFYAVAVPPVKAGEYTGPPLELGIKIDPMPKGEVAIGTITLPSEVDIEDSVSSYTYEWTTKPNNDITVDLEKIDANTLKITIDNTNGSAGKAELVVILQKLKVASGFEGDVTLTMKPIKGAFAPGSVVVAKAYKEGAIEVSVIDDDTFTEDGGKVKIRVEENLVGTFNSSDKLKLVLPDGFEWGAVEDISVISGDLSKGEINVTPDEDELIINTTKKTTQLETRFDITVGIDVEDEDDAEYGNVVVKVKGDYDATPSELIVGKYSEENVTIEAEDPDVVVYAGFNEQDISDIVIEEATEGSLESGKTIKLTLPSNARWVKFGGTYVTPDTDEFKVEEDSGVKLYFVGLEGSDNRTLKLRVEGDSTGGDPAKITIEDNQVALEAGVTGDLKIEVGGSADIEQEEVTVAQIKAPIEVKAEKKTVLLGKNGQEAGTITITETEAGAIQAEFGPDDETAELRITLPEDVTFDGEPDVEVISGDLEIDDVDIDEDDDGNDVLVISIEDESNEASTIRISGIKYNVPRNVPEGDLVVKIGGTAVVETNRLTYYDGDEFPELDEDDNDDAFFEDTDYAVKVANAEVVSEASMKRNAVFQIGSTSYSVNGVQSTMDVAPYVKDGRTYLPVRYVAYALGISADNVMWDGTKATFIGANRVVQVTPGSNVLTINGSSVAMDVVAEVVDGRVMVPFRWIAQAFGAEVNWDEASQTVTMNLQ